MLKQILRKMKFLSLFCFILFVLFGWHDAAKAHRVRIFAYGQGEYIAGGTSFSGGRKLKDAEIIVNAPGGRTLLRTKTDNQGGFRFRIPQEARENHLDLLIVVNGGDGHRGEWPLSAAEYLDSTEIDGKSIQQPEKADREIENGFDNNQMSSFQDIQEQQIRRIVEDVLDKKLAPIKYMLAESRDQGPRLRDILGGIGYILGLAGIVVYFKSKKREV
jgi:nickel transport protein